MAKNILGVFLWFALVCTHSLAQARNPSAKSVPVTEPLRVLFLGNSYTFFNDLPSMLRVMSNSPGSPRRIETKSVALPSATLQMLWEQGAAKATIQERKWDYVVLQEQSTLPTSNPEQMYKFAGLFDALIRKNGARTILFLTWARRGKPKMQLALNQAYYTLANKLDVQVAPVGPAWQIALNLSPRIPLYIEDGSHPTPTGSYLSACVFYLQMLGSEHPCPAFRHPGISPENAATSQIAAIQAVNSQKRMETQSQNPKKTWNGPRGLSSFALRGQARGSSGFANRCRNSSSVISSSCQSTTCSG